MSPRSHAQDAVLAWRRRGLPLPGVDAASEVATFVAEPSLEEIILKACEATANDEREAFAPLVSAARNLSAAHRSGIGESLSGFEAREMAIEDVCEAVNGLDNATSEALERLLDGVRREEGERLGRMLAADESIGSGGDAERAIAAHYAAKGAGR